jgi:hypothetical protein
MEIGGRTKGRKGLRENGQTDVYIDRREGRKEGTYIGKADHTSTYVCV